MPVDEPSQVLTHELEQVVELVHSVVRCGKVSVEGIMEVMNDRLDTVEIVKDSVIKDNEH